MLVKGNNILREIYAYPADTALSFISGTQNILYAHGTQIYGIKVTYQIKTG